MTFEEWLDAAVQYAESNPEQRFGQAVFNFLTFREPATAAAINGTDKDCFYDDKNLGRFLIYLAENWPDR